MCERINLTEIVDLMEEVVRTEYAEDIYVSDRVWETVDGSEWVIYYSKAAQVVAAADDEEQEAAYAEAQRGESDTYGQLLCDMAYLILEARLTERVRDIA